MNLIIFKQWLFLFMMLVFSFNSYSQKVKIKKERIGFISINLIAEGVQLTGSGLKDLNELFSTNNIPLIKNEFESIGISLNYMFRKRISGLDLEFLKIKSTVNDVEDINSSVSSLGSRTVRLSYFRDFNFTSKFYLQFGLGLSFNQLKLKIVDLRNPAPPFNSLLANPSTSYSLNLIQGILDTGGTTFVEFIYKTNWLKSIASGFHLGLRIGFYYPFIKGRAWLNEGVNNRIVVNGIPDVGFEHLNLQFKLKFPFEYLKSK